MKHRLYIDEVGNHDLKSSSNPNERFLSLTGVSIKLDFVKSTLHPEMEKLKTDFFGSHPDEPVVLHRKELLKGKPPFQALRDDSIRSEFNRQLLSLLRSWEYTVITVCLDKKKHMETYSTWHYHAYHYCLEMLLERYIFHLESINQVGDVMAESRGGKQDMMLKRSFSGLYQRGTNYLSAQRIQKVLTSCQLKVKPKSINVAGLQLADLLAHPSRNEILGDCDLLHRPVAPFASQITEILQGKYYQKGGQIYGFGKKLQ